VKPRRSQRGPGRTTRGDRSRPQSDRRKQAAAKKPDAGQNKAAIESPVEDLVSTQPLATHQTPKPLPVALAGADQPVVTQPEKSVDTSQGSKDVAKNAERAAAISKAPAEKPTKKPAARRKSRARKKPKSDQPVVAKARPETKAQEAAISEPAKSEPVKSGLTKEPEKRPATAKDHADSPGPAAKKEKYTVYSSSPTADKHGPGQDEW
jgi:hypothetical protein